ncbi:MAG: LuxR C-terminal-related transcriptional regulator [Gammaproteobacteria bacterium]|nr:LuxR C-terminal-related transcriptional regulator [Gammaproteobacteria bacterium]
MDQKLVTSIHTFNSLFLQLANQPKTVCWIRSVDYNKQLFISPQFELVFGGSCSSLSENPSSWWNYILSNDINNIKPIIYSRIKMPLEEDNSIIFFRILSADGQIKYIRDISFTILNDDNKPLAIAGYGEELSSEFWHRITEKENNIPKTAALSDKIDLIKILNEENCKLFPSEHKNKSNKLTGLKINNIRVRLTHREAQVLDHLKQGKTAKETGREIFLSQRTVETHLENIKNKTGCKTKLELMSKIIHFELGN